MVRAKFRVGSIAPKTGTIHTEENGKHAYNPGTIYEIHLYPVTASTPENAAFYAATPAGEIVLQTIRPEAAEQFALNGEYYVDFTPAD